MPLCTGSSTSACRSLSALCTPDPNYVLKQPESYVYLPENEKFIPEGVLRVGDIDADGFPDLVFVVKGDGGRTRVCLYMNLLGHSFIERRDSQLDLIENADGAAFFDIFEDVSCAF